MFHILKAQDICALTAILLTCNLEDPGSSASVSYLLTGLKSPQWLPFGHAAHGCFGTSSCSQLRSSGLVTFPFSSQTAKPDNLRLHVTDEAYSIFRPRPSSGSRPISPPLYKTPAKSQCRLLVNACKQWAMPFHAKHKRRCRPMNFSRHTPPLFYDLSMVTSLIRRASGRKGWIFLRFSGVVRPTSGVQVMIHSSFPY